MGGGVSFGTKPGASARLFWLDELPVPAVRVKLILPLTSWPFTVSLSVPVSFLS